MGVIQTSTKLKQPVSVIRRLQLSEKFHEVSFIFPEGDSARGEYRALEDQSAGEVTNSTIISVEKFKVFEESTSVILTTNIDKGGGGPRVKWRMLVRGLGGAAVVTVKAGDDLRLSRNGTYILWSSYESTFRFGLTNSGNRTAFARIIVLYTGESNVAEHVPVDVRPASGVVIDRGDS
ncbi:hypothetical protein GCK32_002228 [Trichostrongylus colubriformis]|uniref:Uncharacterized protein n=1 Tax=Trichostrongylus colubriformis TaxID=6319 RepID=A0AAN8IY56_TRICO